MTRLVILESPYAGDVDANIEYARACLRDSLLRGEAPIASHLLYTQPGVLDDLIPSERQHGIDAGLAWKPLLTPASSTPIVASHAGCNTGSTQQRQRVSPSKCGDCKMSDPESKVRVLTQPLLDTTTPMGQFFVAVMAAFAELEKDIIRERTRAGLAAAKLRGRVGGRASLCTDDEILATKRMGTAAAAKRLGYKTPAAYLRRLAVAKKNAAAAAQPQQETADVSNEG